jgi:hypothetical protein
LNLHHHHLLPAAYQLVMKFHDGLEAVQRIQRAPPVVLNLAPPRQLLSLDGQERPGAAAPLLIGSVTVDGDGLIYISDVNNNGVVVYDTHGTWVRTIGSKGVKRRQLQGPNGMCVHGDHLYVADSHNNRIQVRTPWHAHVCSRSGLQLLHLLPTATPHRCFGHHDDIHAHRCASH